MTQRALKTGRGQLLIEKGTVVEKIFSSSWRTDWTLSRTRCWCFCGPREV